MQFEISPDFDNKSNNLLIDSVPVLNSDIGYNDFFINHLQSNQPCIIKNITNSWKATDKWLNKDDTHLSPNLTHLKEHYGHRDVTIYDCTKQFYNSQPTQRIQFEKFLIEIWGTDKTKYLKDWHLKNACKTDDFYNVPILFASDWLNEYLVDNFKDDYRFVYMGQAGTWTPFHADVFGSHSWSANVCGKKRWILFPPGEENHLKNELGSLPFDISNSYETLKHFELIQNAGEGIFVPSGWYHQVWNLEDTISVNHNWINGCNIKQIWLNLESNLLEVKKEISDCTDMDNFLQHCQIMLNASFGMDFYKFFDFIKFIASKRLKFLADTSSVNCKLFHGFSIGVNHAKFDLNAIKTVLELFGKHSDISELFQGELANDLKQLVNNLQI